VREETARALDRAVRTAQADRVPGIVAAVVRDGELAWSSAVGQACFERSEPQTLDHQHRIGSITKTFTAVAVMQLRDTGSLRLDDPLGTHLPEAPRPEPTIRRMLSHLSGLQREPAGAVWETLEFPSGEELVAGLSEVEEVSAPGRRWHYSNLAFALLGEVVERAGGLPYERYVEERILRPLGLLRTGFAPVPPVATPYFVEPWSDVLHPEPALAETGSAGAAGSLWSTAADLCRWAAFLADPDPSVLAPATLDEMCELQAMLDPGSWAVGWGLGLELWRAGDRVLVGHEGAMPGFLACVFTSRKERLGAAVLANAGNRSEPGRLCAELITTALDGEPPLPDAWAPGVPPPDELAGALGHWWTEGYELTLGWYGGRLEARMVGARHDDPPAVFERVQSDLYRVVSGRETGVLLRLVRDGSGTVVKLYWATYPCAREPRASGAE
jgi:CubicO group peptidase (beta-lactamase class C family)